MLVVSDLFDNLSRSRKWSQVKIRLMASNQVVTLGCTGILGFQPITSVQHQASKMKMPL